MKLIIVRKYNKEYYIEYSFYNITIHRDIVEMTQGSTHWLICAYIYPSITARRAQWVVSSRHHTFSCIDIVKSGPNRKQEL